MARPLMNFRRVLRPGPAIGLSIIFLAASLLLTPAVENKGFLGDFYGGLVALNVIGIVIMTTLTAVNISPLNRQLRAQALCARLALRFVVIFALLQCLPDCCVADLVTAVCAICLALGVALLQPGALDRERPLTSDRSAHSGALGAALLQPVLPRTLKKERSQEKKLVKTSPWGADHPLDVQVIQCLPKLHREALVAIVRNSYNANTNTNPALCPTVFPHMLQQQRSVALPSPRLL